CRVDQRSGVRLCEGIGMPPTARAGKSPVPLSGPQVTFGEPQPFDAVTNVRCGTGGTGTICAFGTAALGGAQLLQVFGKVIGPHDMPQGTHLQEGNTTPGAVLSDNRSWEFKGANEVPNAPCAPADPLPTDNNAQFVLWCVFSGKMPLEFNF